MIADDEPHVRRILAMKLEAAGYVAFTAHDGQEALQLVRTHRPDLVITDFEMPEMTGDELAAQIQRDPETRGTPIFMLTARGHCLPPERLRQGNIVLLLDKPFSANSVLKLIEAQLTPSAAA